MPSALRNDVSADFVPFKMERSANGSLPISQAIYAALVAGENRSSIRERLQVTRGQIAGVVHRRGMQLPPGVAAERQRDGPRDRVEAKVARKERAQSSRHQLRIVAAAMRPVGGIALLDLTRAHCRFPFGDAPFVFCGDAAHDGGPYCEAHAALCYTSPREVQRRSRSPRRAAIKAFAA